MASAEQLRAMRKKAGIGEFAKKAGSKSKTKNKTRSTGSTALRHPVYDWDQTVIANRFGGTQPPDEVS